MRRKIFFTVIASVVVFTAIFIWYKNTIKISQSIVGINYQLGEGNHELVRPIKVQINGYLNRNLNGTKTFKGTISFLDQSVPSSFEGNNLNITFSKRGDGLLIYKNIKDGVPVFFSYGIIFINKQFSEFTIMKYTSENNDPTKKTWSADNGLMISGPAQNREQAIDLSNKLTRDYLKKYTLK